METPSILRETQGSNPGPRPVALFGCVSLTLQYYTRFPSSPLTIRVPFFLLFGFNKGPQKEKGQKGTTGEPSTGKSSRNHNAYIKHKKTKKQNL